MIIKMTVRDNDFAELLESFSKNLTMKLLTYYLKNSKLPEDSIEEKLKKSRENFDNYDRVNTILNPNTDVKLKKNSEDYNFLKNTIEKEFEEYLINKKVSKDSKEYLLNNFKVEISYEMIDKLENGEVVYYFTTQNVFITQ